MFSVFANSVENSLKEYQNPTELFSGLVNDFEYPIDKVCDIVKSFVGKSYGADYVDNDITVAITANHSQKRYKYRVGDFVKIDYECVNKNTADCEQIESLSNYNKDKLFKIIKISTIHEAPYILEGLEYTSFYEGELISVPEVWECYMTITEQSLDGAYYGNEHDYRMFLDRPFEENDYRDLLFEAAEIEELYSGTVLVDRTIYHSEYSDNDTAEIELSIVLDKEHLSQYFDWSKCVGLHPIYAINREKSKMKLVL